jgi:TIR domain
MSDLFVSYASADRERVAPLVQRLEQLGFSVWWDRDIAHGQNYHRVIEQALDQAKCAIVVWSRDSVNSEWVVNEASSARKRNALVPVLIDTVEAPLEFRHLQTADLREDNLNKEREYEKLQRSVLQIVGSSKSAPSLSHAATKPKTLWQTPIGWAIGAGVLLLGVAALLAVLKQIGLIGTAVQLTAQNSPPIAQPSLPEKVAPSDPSAVLAPVPVKSPAAERINLLSPENGAQIVAAGEEGWRRILEKDKLDCTILSKQSFAVVGLRKEQPTPITTLAVHVESQSSDNVKQLALFVSDQERGPFKKIGEFEIPNHKNMRAPFHEFSFETVTARYVKLQIVGFMADYAANGIICTMQLYGTK